MNNNDKETKAIAFIETRRNLRARTKTIEGFSPLTAKRYRLWRTLLEDPNFGRKAFGKQGAFKDTSNAYLEDRSEHLYNLELKKKPIAIIIMALMFVALVAANWFFEYYYWQCQDGFFGVNGWVFFVLTLYPAIIMGVGMAHACNGCDHPMEAVNVWTGIIVGILQFFVGWAIRGIVNAASASNAMAKSVNGTLLFLICLIVFYTTTIKFDSEEPTTYEDIKNKVLQSKGYKDALALDREGAIKELEAILDTIAENEGSLIVYEDNARQYTEYSSILSFSKTDVDSLDMVEIKIDGELYSAKDAEKLIQTKLNG